MLKKTLSETKKYFLKPLFNFEDIKKSQVQLSREFIILLCIKTNTNFTQHVRVNRLLLNTRAKLLESSKISSQWTKNALCCSKWVVCFFERLWWYFGGKKMEVVEVRWSYKWSLVEFKTKIWRTSRQFQKGRKEWSAVFKLQFETFDL